MSLSIIKNTKKLFSLSSNIDLTGYQPLLVSATNIKTINGSSLLGSGDLVISSSPSLTSTLVGFGNSSNLLTSNTGFFVNFATETFRFDSAGGGSLFALGEAGGVQVRLLQGGSIETYSGGAGKFVISPEGVETARITIAGVIIASGMYIQLGNAATTGLVAGTLATLTNASIVIKDSTGQSYRVPCII